MESISESAALVDVGGGLWYELLIPGSDVERLSGQLGQEVILHTIHYLEGNPSHGQVTPRLIGFRSEADRAFFKVFTTVKGIGVRKALRALVRPAGDIAAAIAAKDAATLQTLPEIGARSAERIIAELHGKVEQFAGELSAAQPGEPPLGEAAAEAISVLVQLGERRTDAAALIERVLAVAPDLTSPEEIIQHAYRIKAGGT